MSVEVKNVIAWISLLGIPSIFAMTAWCIKSCVKFGSQLKILMEAIQAQMRKNLLDDYHFYEQQGWISDDDMKEWENQYQSYHALGKNGILDSRRTKLMSLPSFPPNGGSN